MALSAFSRFLRLAEADNLGLVQIRPRKIYIMPTCYGFGFGLLLMLMLIGSINYANNLGFFLTFLLAGLGLVTILHTWRNLLGVELQAGRVNPVFAGDKANFEILLINKRRSERPDIRLQLKGSEAVETDLQNRSRQSLSLLLSAPRRGKLGLPRFSISTRYPTGLLRAWCYVELESECLVYPAPGKRIPPADMPDYSQSAKGDRVAGVDDFVGLRPYHDGDSPRHINWKAFAREQGLQTKQFGGDRSERLWIDWHSLPEMETEARLSRLCRGILDACDQEQEFGLRLPGFEISPARGQNHRHNCLAALALFGEKG